MAMAKMSLARHTSITKGKLLGTLAWCVAAYTTALVLIELEVTGVEMVIAAIILQAICTYLESQLWHGKLNVATVGALVFDVLANASGMWFYILNFEQTTMWAMVQQAFGTGDMTITTKLGVAIVIAIALAVAPETLWREKA